MVIGKVSVSPPTLVAYLVDICIFTYGFYYMLFLNQWKLDLILYNSSYFSLNWLNTSKIATIVNCYGISQIGFQTKIFLFLVFAQIFSTW